MGEAESLKVRPDYLFTGNICLERLGCLLESSLSFEEMGFLGKEEKTQAWVFLDLGIVLFSKSDTIPSKELFLLLLF